MYNEVSVRRKDLVGRVCFLHIQCRWTLKPHVMLSQLYNNHVYWWMMIVIIFAPNKNQPFYSLLAIYQFRSSHAFNTELTEAVCLSQRVYSIKIDDNFAKSTEYLSYHAQPIRKNVRLFRQTHKKASINCHCFGWTPVVNQIQALTPSTEPFSFWFGLVSMKRLVQFPTKY